MKMKMKLFLSGLMLLALSLTISCQKDDEPLPVPVAAFTPSKATVAVGEAITFTNESTDAISYTWSFGDATTSTDKAPSKTYTTAGTFTVTLVATGAGGSNSKDQNITVLAGPVAAFTPSKTTATVGETITFTNESTDATSYTWSFGDGTSSTDKTPSKTYTAAGTFKVTLVATGAGGTNSKDQNITVVVGAEVYFIDYTDAKIAKFALSNPATVTTILDITDNNGLALAHDAVNDKIYFSGYTTATDIGGVWKVNMDGTAVTNVITDLWDPYGIALNVTGNKLYVADEADGSDVGHIYRTDLSGANSSAVVTKDGAQFRAIALDLTNNKMYYYEVYDENLWVANLDGTNPEIVVAGAYGYGILVDAANSKIYFDDQNSGTDGELKSASLTGTNVTTVDATASRIYGIVKFGDKLYWSARDNGEIYQSNLNGTGRVTIKTGLSSPRGIFLK